MKIAEVCTRGIVVAQDQATLTEREAAERAPLPPQQSPAVRVRAYRYT